MDTITQPNDGDMRGDLLVGAEAIAAFLTELGWAGSESVDPEQVYYFKRAGILPIGSTAPGGGGKLLGSKNRISRAIAKMTRGGSTAA